MNRQEFLTLTGLGLLSLKLHAQTGLPDDMSGVFDGINPDLPASIKIARDGEPGQRIIISGKMFRSDGRTPAPNVLMYFYHTNAAGIYAKRGNEPRGSAAWWHGYNRGYLKTNSKGEYMIDTIRPGVYPSRSEPAHIHLVVKAPSQSQVYDMGCITFSDDALATEAYWRRVQKYDHPRDGGTLLRMSDGVMKGVRNFALYRKYDR